MTFINKQKLQAFTLIELLVIIGIIGILATIGVISFGKVRGKARRSACIATLRSSFNSDENLIAYWNFDEGSGTTAKDYWGNVANIIGNVVFTSQGLIDTALDFNQDLGDTGHMNSGDESKFKYRGNNLSVSLWIKVNIGETNGGWILSKPWNGGGVYNWWIFLSNTNHIDTFLRGSSGVSLLSNSAISANIWHQIVIVLEDPPKTVKLYIDGNLDNSLSHTIANYIPVGSDANIPLSFGCVYPYSTATCWIGSDFALSGIIDEVIVYNRALSANEIANHYKACKK